MAKKQLKQKRQEKYCIHLSKLKLKIAQENQHEQRGKKLIL